MWPFKRKKIYKVKWTYVGCETVKFAEYIKAYDLADAWKRIKKDHCMEIALLGIDEVQGD